MSRPHGSSTRNSDLRVRLSPQERDQLDREAKRFGLATSAFLRTIAGRIIERGVELELRPQVRR
jgi:hypothetical protein